MVTRWRRNAPKTAGPYPTANLIQTLNEGLEGPRNPLLAALSVNKW